MSNHPAEEESAFDPDGILTHLVREISFYGTQAVEAERILIRRVADAKTRGATIDDMAAELGLSRTDAETLTEGESMLKRRISDL